MKKKEWLAVFAYSFAHRKTQDFLQELWLAGFSRIVVFAAPHSKLRVDTQAVSYASEIVMSPPVPTGDICHSYGFEYLEISHDDHAVVEEIVESKGISLAVIAGARILPAPVTFIVSKEF